MSSMKKKEEILKSFSPPEQRWSGLESDAMKLQGCSLLVPHDVYYEAGPVNLAPQRIQIGVDNFVDFPGGQPVRITASSKKGNRIMPLYMVIAGKVRFTKEDKTMFSLSMMNKEDAKRMGLPVNNNKFDWPDVRALMLCPVCAAKQETDKEYWMVLHHLQQVQMESFSFASRQVPRLMCLSCFENLWPIMVSAAGMRQEPALMLNPGFPVAAFPAPKGIKSVADNFDLWETSGMYAAIDLKMRTQTTSFFNSTVQGGGGMKLGNLYDRKDPMVEKNAEGVCLYCNKTKEGGNHSCSQCKVANYCSRTCQKLDWKRHRIFCNNNKK